MDSCCLPNSCLWFVVARILFFTGFSSVRVAFWFGFTGTTAA